jgi:hypothetical protein
MSEEIAMYLRQSRSGNSIHSESNPRRRIIVDRITKILFISLWLGSTPSAAQLRIHDAKRDAAAQDAKKAADKIQSGDIFRKVSSNLQIMSERDIATTVADARLEMEATINSFRQWSDVTALKDRVNIISSPVPPEEVERRKQALATANGAIKNQIAALSKSAGSDEELKPFIDKLGDVDSALGFASSHLGVDSEASKTAMMVLTKLQGLYQSYQNQFDAVNTTQARLRELRINVKKALLARLSVEEDYLLTQVALYARYEREFNEVEHWKRQCAVPQGVHSDEYIDETLDRLATSRDDLEKAVRSLFACGSLAAEGMLPGRLLTLRLAQLGHLRSIQLSAANARVYEVVLGGGVERLALFYQGGIKPEALAQMIQSLSTVGIFAKLLTQ